MNKTGRTYYTQQISNSSAHAYEMYNIHRTMNVTSSMLALKHYVGRYLYTTLLCIVDHLSDVLIDRDAFVLIVYKCRSSQRSAFTELRTG